MTSLPNPITTSRNPSCGWPVNWSVIPIWSLWLCLLCCPQRSKWTRTGSYKSKEIYKKPRRPPCPTRMKICKQTRQPSSSFSIATLCPSTHNLVLLLYAAAAAASFPVYFFVVTNSKEIFSLVPPYVTQRSSKNLQIHTHTKKQTNEADVGKDNN